MRERQIAVLLLLLPGCWNGRKTSNETPTGSSREKSVVMSAATSNPVAPVLVPGQSIGPIRIGMGREEVGQLGLEIRPHPSGQLGDNVRLVGPYYVVFDQDHVASVAFTLTGSRTGIMVAGRSIPATVSLDELSKAIPDCGPTEEREGGKVISCGGGRTFVKSGAEDPTVVEVQIVASNFP